MYPFSRIMAMAKVKLLKLSSGQPKSDGSKKISSQVRAQEALQPETS